MRLKSKNFKYYVLIVFVVTLVQGFFSKITNLLNFENVVIGGDITYELIPIKIAYEGSLLGFSNNIGWPNGYATWAYPTMGLGTTLIAWTLGVLPFKLSIFFVYFVIMIIGNTVNSLVIFWAIQEEFEKKSYAVFASILVGLSSLIFYRFGHMPVIWFYFIIILIGIIFKLEQKSIKNLKVFTIILITGIFSPFWWNSVVILVSATFVLIFLLQGRIFYKELFNWIVILLGSVASIFPTLVLYLSHKDLVGPSGRNPWQSNVFGGRLSDLLVASPFLNQKFNLIDKLDQAISPEARITQFGLMSAIFAAISVIFLISVVIRKVNNFPKYLGILIFIIFLFFLLGGLGNLQATLLFLVDQSSPARSWSRLVIFLSIIGVFILFKFLENKKVRTNLIIPLVFIMFLISFVDLSFASKPIVLNKSQIEEFNSVKFIEENTNNCPILQLPLDTYPIPQDFLFENGGKFVYNEFIPYLISNKNQWSIGGTPENKYWLEEIKIPRTIESSAFLDLDKKGFCAILFDRDYANWQINRNAGIDPQTGALTNWGNWPGVEMKGIEPNFQDNRFEVYLLK